MADIVDMASGLEAEHLARSLARVARDIPAGQAGVCDECLELRPRLVRGLCGFCRDGRVPPPSSFEIPTAPQPEECSTVVNPQPSDSFQIVSIRARDDVLRAIRERAEKQDVSLAAAALDLVENGIRLADLPFAASDLLPLDDTTKTTVDPTDPDVIALALADAPIGALLDTLRDRLAAAGTVDDLTRALIHAGELERAATARAETAEGTLASLRASLKGLVA